MANHLSKRAQNNYLRARILWFIAVIVLPLSILNIVLVIPLVFLSFFMRIMGAVAYAAGNDENKNRNDLAKRLHRITIASRLYCFLLILALVIVVASWLNGSGNPYSIAALVVLGSLFSALMATSAISMALLNNNIKKKLSTSRALLKASKRVKASKKRKREYYDDSI